MFPFDYLNFYAVYFIIKILGVVAYAISILLLLGLLLVIIRNYNKNFWNVSLKNNLFLLTLLGTILIASSTAILISLKISFFGIYDPLLTAWVVIIFYSIVLGSSFHSGVSEYSSALSVVVLFFYLYYFQKIGDVFSLISSLGIAFFIGFIIGPYIATRYVRGLLNYSIAGAVYIINVRDKNENKNVVNVIKDILNSSELKEKYRVKLTKEEETGRYALSDGKVSFLPESKIEFVMRGRFTRPIMTALRGKLTEEKDFMPAPFMEPSVTISTCMDALATLVTWNELKGSVSIREHGIVLAISSSERTTTKRYVSKRSKQLLMSFIRDMERYMEQHGIAYKKIPSDGDVIIYQWGPYIEGGEANLEPSSFINLNDEKLIEIIEAVKIIKEELYIEDLWATLRKMSLRRLVVIGLSLLSTYLGIGI